MTNVIITKDGVWVGSGPVDAYGQVECSADLRPNNDKNYDEIDDGIENGETSGTTKDGYSWYIED